MKRTSLFSVLVLAGFSAVAQKTYHVPNWIDSSGKTDVTLKLQTWLDLQPDSSTILFPKNGNYRVDGTLLLHHRKALKLDGNGSRLFATGDGSTAVVSNLTGFFDLWQWPRKRGQLALRDSRDLKVHNFVLEGSNPYTWEQEESYNAALEAQHNLDVEGVNGLQVFNCTFRKPWGDFIYLGTSHELSGEITQNVVVMQCQMEQNGRQGISLVGTRNVVLALNDLSKTRRSTFDIEPDAENTGTSYLFIRRNTVGEGRLMFVASGGNSAGKIDHVVIDRNRLFGRPLNIATYGDGKSRHHWWVCNNEGDPAFAYGSPRPLLEFYGVDYVCVSGNTHWFQPMDKDDLPGEGTVAVYFAGVKHYSLTGNAWHSAEFESAVFTDCRPWEKPVNAPSEFSQPSLRRQLPPLAIGKLKNRVVSVFSSGKKAYTLYGVIGRISGMLKVDTLQTGYSDIHLPDGYEGYTLKVGTKYYTIK